MLKAVSALSVLGIAALVARLAAVRGIAPAPAAALVALNPLVLVHVIGGPHNDGLMALAMLAGVALVLGASERGRRSVHRGRRRGQGPGGAGGAVRPARRRHGAATGATPLGAGVAAAVVACVGLAVFGSSALHGFSAFTGSQETVSYHSVPATAARIAGLDLSLTRGACWPPLTASGSSGSCSGAHAAATGCEPPPGPRSACSAPPST